LAPELIVTSEEIIKLASKVAEEMDALLCNPNNSGLLESGRLFIYSIQFSRVPIVSSIGITYSYNELNL
jgi:hypothetical protein